MHSPHEPPPPTAQIIMENEYANFGLPGDPANRPKQPNPPQPRGWFSRNLWWLLPSAFLVVVLPCGCCGGIVVWAIRSLKSSEPYQIALERVRKNPQVIEQLGEPIEEASWAPLGNFSYATNNGVASGEADFTFSVAGPKGTAHVHATAHCREGKWGFLLLEVTPANTGKAISLPTDGKPKKAEANDGAGAK
jgi:hypothetical protein